MKKNWLEVTEEEGNVAEVCCLVSAKVKNLPGMHHMAVGQTLFFMWKVDPDITREIVQKVVRDQSIDTTPSTHTKQEKSR